jgi:hypothetical protein
MGFVKTTGLPLLKDDPRYGKFCRMLKMHIPRGAVEIKMRAEGLDPSMLDLDPELPVPPDASAALKSAVIGHSADHLWAMPFFAGASDGSAVAAALSGLRKTGVDPATGALGKQYTATDFTMTGVHRAEFDALVAGYERAAGDTDALASDPELTQYGLDAGLLKANPPTEARDFARFAFDERYTVGGNEGGKFEGMRETR